MVADLTLFDPIKVAGRSSYKAGEQGLPSVGISHVIVNGTIVVKDSTVLKDVNPGQPIRYPMESKGRYQPLDVKGWIETYAIPIHLVDECVVPDTTGEKH